MPEIYGASRIARENKSRRRARIGVSLAARAAAMPAVNVGTGALFFAVNISSYVERLNTGR